MKHSPEKTVIVLTGPTAVGKTAIAIKLAKLFDTAIISADSRQCYRELNIGVARPSPAELAAILHYFIATHSIQQEVTAAAFEQYALTIADAIFKTHDTLVLAGGTGLYINAFCEGLDVIPAIPGAVREAVRSDYARKGIEWLTAELTARDPRFAIEGEMQNPQRMMRALEVWQSTGRSIIEFQKGSKKARPFRIKKIGLELSRHDLNERIEARVDRMMDAGLLEEVRTLLPYQQLNALQTVGYSELFSFLNGEQSLAEALQQIKIHTRQYAKRQMTWFKRDATVKWFSPGEEQAISAYAGSPA